MESRALQKTIDGSVAGVNRIRELWLSNRVHDLSNPLFAARGYLRLALEERDNPLPEAQRRYVMAALENVSKLVTLSQELGDFQEIEELECESVSFRALLQEILAALRASSGHVVLTQDISEGSLLTLGDPGKLSGAVRELLNAAVEFTEFRGSLHVYAAEENEKILFDLLAMRDAGAAGRDPTVDVTTAFKMWRLHGGVCSLGPISPGTCRITCELPVVRLLEC